METINQKNLSKYPLPELGQKPYWPAILGGLGACAVGVALFFVQEPIQNLTLANLVILLGFAVVVFGIQLVFRNTRRWFYLPTQSPILKKETFYAVDDFAQLKSLVESKRIDQALKLRQQQEGNVKLLVLTSKDGKFTAAQVFRYQPFEFRPETEILINHNS